MINNVKIKRNNIFSLILLLCISFSIITIVGAVAPDPGHNFAESSGNLVLGNIIYGSGTDTAAALAPNITTTKNFLSQTGNGSVSSAPVWSTLSASDIPDISATYSPRVGNTSLVTTGTLTSGALGSGFTAISDALISSASTWNAKMTNPMTTEGDIIYGGISGASTRLAGSAGFLKSTGASAPTWSSVNLSSDVGSSILPVANGGTGMAYFTVDGPASTAKTFTFPNANATVLTSNTPVTVAQGGTGLGTLTTGNVMLGAGTSNVTFVAPGTSGNVLTSNGSTWTSTAPVAGGAPTYVVLGANVASTASNAYQNITGLSWPLLANTNYDIECKILYNASATTIGVGIGWTGPASPTLTSARMVAGLTAATVGGTTIVGNDTGTFTTASVATTNNNAYFTGFWNNGANAGTLQMRFRPETATANGITIRAGSFCKYSTY